MTLERSDEPQRMTAVQHPLLICLSYLPGEETRAEQTLAHALLRNTECCPVVLVRLGTAAAINVEKSWAAGRQIRILAEADDPRGPLMAAIACIRREYAGYDLLHLRPGVDVPPAWDSRLRWAAYVEPNVGSVGPLSGPLGAVGLPPLLSDTKTADRLTYAVGRRTHIQVSTIDAACVYLRADALQAAGEHIAAIKGDPVACLERLARILYRHGYCSIVGDHLWVSDGSPIAENDAAGNPRAQRMAAVRAAARDRLTPSKILLAPIPGIRSRPVQLHVMHNWGGGLNHWVEDYCRADTGRTNLVLKPVGTPRCYAHGLALYEHIDDPEPVHCWKLDPPIRTMAITQIHYRHVLREIIDMYGVSAILISSFFGHSLDVLESDVPTLMVCHDYFPFCPAVSITYRNKRQGPMTVCTSCPGSRLAECFVENQYNRFILDATAEDWMSVRRRYVDLVLKRSIPIIVPTPSVQHNLVALEPQLADAAFHVVAHGTPQFPQMSAASSHATLPATARDALAAIPKELLEPEGRPRVLVLGRLTSEKGLPLLLDAYPKLAEVCHLVLLGCGNEGRQLAGKPSVSIIPEYDWKQLPTIVAEIKPQMGLLLSTCAETFSYTLSELMLLGIPPLATRLGSFVDRIEEGTLGFLFEPTGADLVRKIRGLLAEPLRLAEVRRALAAKAHRSPAEMVAQYHQILPVSTFSAQLYARGQVKQPPGCGLNELKSHFAVGEETLAQLVVRTYRTIREKLAQTPRLYGWQRWLAGAVLSAGYCILKICYGWIFRPARKTAEPAASAPEFLQGRRDAVVLEEQRAA